MKKKELLAMKKMYVTQKMMEIMYEDTGERETTNFTYSKNITYIAYKWYLYYRVIVENGILKVAVFTRKRMVAGDRNPQYEIYLSKDEKTHLTYEVDKRKWRTGKINMLDYDTEQYGRYGKKPWVSDGDKKKINDYLGYGNKEAKEAILTFQCDIAKEKIKQKYRSEQEQIDAVMNAVPELPKDFDKWVLDQGFINERYLLYKYGDKENTAYCTHCGKMVNMKEKLKHNQLTICPVCKSKVQMKAWKKQKYLVDNKKVGILQSLTDGSGYILRRFKCRLERRRETGYKLEFAGCWEINRFKINEHFIPVEYFEWGEYKHTGMMRWCHELNHGYYDWYYQDEECVLYSRNLKKLRKGTELQYIPMEIMYRHNPGCYSNPTDTIRNIRRIPKVEYLIKAGLYRLAWDLTAGQNWGLNVVDWNKNKPWEALRVTKDQMKFCIRINIGIRQMKVLQLANEYTVSLTEEQLCFFTKEVGPGLVGHLFQYGHPGKFHRYLKCMIEDKGRCGDYIDYLSDIEYFQIPPTEDVLFPKDFQQIHQRIALQRQEQEDAIEKMEINEKDKLLRKMLPELGEIYGFEDENFCIILPICKEDFNREGRENHNCVGGSYYDKMIKRKSCVMFLRKKEEPDKAFCTVEMDGGRILQCRAVRNSEPPKEAKEFMEKFSGEVEKRIRKRNEKIRLQVTA